MPRFRLDIEYDGGPYAGWQRQAGHLSVQEAIEQAIGQFCGETITLRGAGRTDAGVHATGQVAHIDLAKAWREDTVRDAVNAHLQAAGARIAIVRERLAGFAFRAHDNLPFVWLTLPDPWLSGTFKNACLEQGVLIDDEDEFKAGRSEQVSHGARFGISQPRLRQEVADGVGIIRRLLDEGRAGYDSFS